MIFGSDVVTRDPKAASPDISNNAYMVNGTPFSQLKPTSAVVSSSDSADHFVNNLGTNIGNAGANPPATPTPGNPAAFTFDPNSDPDTIASNKAYEDSRKALATQRDQEIADLTSNFGTEKSKLGGTQAAETGTTNRNLLYLQQGGQSASAQAYLVSLEATHRQEMDTLTAKYNSAIEQAKNAYSSKDFDAAQKELEAARKIKDDAYTRNQNFLDYSLKLRSQANADTKLAYDMQSTQRDQQKQMLQFAQDNGLHPDAAFFASGGQIFDSATGKAFGSKEDALTAGVKADLSNVQMIEKEPNVPIYNEWKAYQKEGGKLGFDAYQTYDINRKAKAAGAGQGTQTDRDNAILAPIIQSGYQLLDANSPMPGKTVNGNQIILKTDKFPNGIEIKGTDGYMSPEVFTMLRQQVPPNTYAKFNAAFGPYLKPQNRAQLGVGSYNVYADQ